MSIRAIVSGTFGAGKRHYLYLAMMILFLVAACANKGKNEQVKVQPKKPTTLVLPEIPVMLTEPEDRAVFLVQHYWDNYDFADTTYIHYPQITEQAIADYADILNYAPLETVDASMKAMLSKAEANDAVFGFFTGLLEKYLYDPNSPLRNEEFYIPVLEYIVNSDKISETDKTRPRYRLERAMKNRLGTIATDFTFTNKEGKKSSMHAIKSPYLLLYFHNPDCHNCKEVSEMIKTSQLIAELMKSGELKILAMYIDEDLDLWKKHVPDIPSSWINAYDPDQYLKANEVYDFKAIPTLYLLDENKTVLLKDPTFQQVEAWFGE